MFSSKKIFRNKIFSKKKFFPRKIFLPKKFFKLVFFRNKIFSKKFLFLKKLILQKKFSKNRIFSAKLRNKSELGYFYYFFVIFYSLLFIQKYIPGSIVYFVLFCMKLVHHKGTKVTEPDLWKKILVGRRWRKTPILGAFLMFFVHNSASSH